MKNLKKYLLGGLLLVAGLCAHANEFPVGKKANSNLDITVQNIYKTDNNDLVVEVLLDLSQVNIKSQFEQVFTPFITNDVDTVVFDSFAVTGHKRLLSNERNNRVMPITFYKNKLVATKATHPDTEISELNPALGTYAVRYTTPWRNWMETAVFEVESQVFGCAQCLKKIARVGDEATPLAQTDFVQRTFTPEFLYVTPVAEAVKMREISARAYIDFVVNRIEINPTYRRNPQELAKIRATIDSVKNDKDINITSLHINGTASPEGNYQNNVRLAKGRTESLKDYVQSLYKFPAGLITTSFEAVDWKGLADFLRMVVNRGIEVADVNARPSNSAQMDSIRYDQFQNIDFDLNTINGILPHAANILAIVDSDIEPYARNRKIQTSYPQEYNWLLKNVYPALRHSDYRIQFEVKTYTAVSEILDVMANKPQNLSLAELFVAANSQEPGSPLYNRAFELAVVMYPEDETANLNAATAAMVRGDVASAKKYLSKIKNQTPESRYADAMLLLLEDNQPDALVILQSLTNSSSPEVSKKATAAKEELEEVIFKNSRNFILLP